MELSHEEEVEIPMPINSAYVGFHGYHHGSMAHHRYHHHPNHDPSSSSTQNQHNNNNNNNNNNNIILPSNNSNGTTTNSTITTTTATTAVIDEDDRSPLGQNHSHCNNDDKNNDDNDDDDSSTKAIKKEMMMVRYKECQRNHAACIGGNARDGCGEFMPSSGEEGSIESLICSVCNCHRNFHRKEFQGGHNMNMNMDMNMTTPTHNSSYSPFYPSTTPPHFLNNRGRMVILGGNGVGYPTIPGQVVPRSLGVNNMKTYDHSNHHYNHNHNLNQGVKKRFRTKFSQEQKEKMLEFAEKVGWKIQRQEENVVQQFCQQIGIKRRVLKVWMHNNKHSFAKKNDMIIDNNDINNSS